MTKKTIDSKNHEAKLIWQRLIRDDDFHEFLKDINPERWENLEKKYSIRIEILPEHRTGKPQLQIYTHQSPITYQEPANFFNEISLTIDVSKIKGAHETKDVCREIENAIKSKIETRENVRAINKNGKDKGIQNLHKKFSEIDNIHFRHFDLDLKVFTEHETKGDFTVPKNSKERKILEKMCFALYRKPLYEMRPILKEKAQKRKREEYIKSGTPCEVCLKKANCKKPCEKIEDFLDPEINSFSRGKPIGKDEAYNQKRYEIALEHQSCKEWTANKRKNDE